VRPVVRTGLVPFVNRRVLGAVAGIVGAGGNAGAVAAGFLFRVESLSFQGSFLVLGITVTAASFVALSIRFRVEPRDAEPAAVPGDSASEPAAARDPAALATGLAVAGRGSD
jgi:MFS transporter, NNP family, nitrate/nitrite transporter